MTRLLTYANIQSTKPNNLLTLTNLERMNIMIANCSEEFNKYHIERYKKMSIEELIKEYDAVVQVLDLDCVFSLFCLDELLSWESLIADRCVEIVREKLLKV